MSRSTAKQEEDKAGDDERRRGSDRGQPSASARLEALDNKRMAIDLRSICLGEYAVLNNNYIAELKELREQRREAEKATSKDDEEVKRLIDEIQVLVEKKKKLTSDYEASIANNAVTV